MSSLAEKWNYRRYRRFRDDEWLKVLLDSIHGKSKVPMPGFPTPEIQRSFVGQSNEDAINEAWRFYSLMSERWKKEGLRLGQQSHVLDFGCGWGRFARMFLRDVPASHIYCADAWERPLDICRETGVPGEKVRLGAMPPSDLPSARFDIAFAYSVFSHLSPKTHLAWRTELARVVKPGGVVFITTQARWFLDECRRFREHPEQISHQWHRKLAKSFVDYDSAVRQYEQGEFLFAADDAPQSGAEEKSSDTPSDPIALRSEYYGEAVVPDSYFESQWCHESGFEMIDFIADRSVCEQAIAILRKK
jgi:ubiquinone/menaquinone biosynthesis C-methylase UbiE